MTLIEIAVYAAVLSGASPIVCHVDESGVTRCSNGYIAQMLSANVVRFGNGVTVNHDGDHLLFSNGIETRLGPTGFLEFSNGLSVHRLVEGNYAFSNGLVCRSELPELVHCVRPPT
jgi:hypothetical protein